MKCSYLLMLVLWSCFNLRQIAYAAGELDPQPEASTDEVCSPFQKLVQRLTDIRDGFNVAPFMIACSDPKLIENRPETGLLVRSLVDHDSEGLKSATFFSNVIERKRARIEASRNQMNNIEACMKRGPTPECEELNHLVDHDLPEFVSGARFHLSLGQGNHQISTLRGKASNQLNTKMKSLGGYKEKAWQPLTPDETRRGLGQIESYKKAIATEAHRRLEHGDLNKDNIMAFENEALMAIRYQHYATYEQMLGSFPLLQYLGGPYVTHSEVLTAFMKMRENLDAQTKQLDEFSEMLKKDPLPAALLKIFDFNAEVEDTLLADERYCGLATSLSFTRANRQLGNGLTIAAPLIAVSFLVPPALGLALGAGTGALGAYHSIENRENFREQALGYIYGDAYGMELANLERANRQMKYDIVTMPIGLGVGGAAMNKVFKASPNVIQTAVKIFRSSPQSVQAAKPVESPATSPALTPPKFPSP